MSTGGGPRDFLLYRDPGIAAATGGQVICHLANADMRPAIDKVPPEVTDVLSGGINLCDRPLAAADRGGSGYSVAYRGSADI